MTTLFEKWFQSKLDEELEMHCSQIPKLMKSYRLVLIQINIDSCLWFVWLSSCFMSYRYLCLLPVSLRFAGILFRFSKPQTQTIKSSKFCMSIHTSMIIIWYDEVLPVDTLDCSSNNTAILPFISFVAFPCHKSSSNRYPSQHRWKPWNNSIIASCLLERATRYYPLSAPSRWMQQYKWETLEKVLFVFICDKMSWRRLAKGVLPTTLLQRNQRFVLFIARPKTFSCHLHWLQ